uniref:Uncharacterized protein n=1 Tax=Panagrolaimus sp. JU765 TaxID=591449 RepID=A0AC34RSY7_9BILA
MKDNDSIVEIVTTWIWLTFTQISCHFLALLISFQIKMASLPRDKVELSNLTNMPPSILKLHNALKCLSKAHVINGIFILILGAYADVISHRASTVRLHGVIECCAIYFLFTGITGICGAASYRRGLIITFMIMSLHAALIFVPALIVTSSFDIHFYNHECWGECDWHLLAVSVPHCP